MERILHGQSGSGTEGGVYRQKRRRRLHQIQGVTLTGRGAEEGLFPGDLYLLKPCRVANGPAVP